MQRTWKPEEVVDAARARRLIEAQFPALAPASVELLGQGWDNTVYRVNGEWVFRFPRRAIAVPLLECESRVLPELAVGLPLPVPDPCFVGAPSETYRWPFHGYPELTGRTACRAQLSRSARVTLAGELGRFLRALHDKPTAALVARGLPRDAMRRLDLAYRRPQVERRIEEALAAGLVTDGGVLRRLADDVPADWTPRDDVLVHGDLYARHLLVDAAHRPAGVIDWGDVHLGDPAIDLAIAAGFLPPEAHPAFLAGYGAVDAECWRVARFRALFSALAILVYGHDTSDADLVREGRIAITHLLDA